MTCLAMQAEMQIQYVRHSCRGVDESPESAVSIQAVRRSISLPSPVIVLNDFANDAGWHAQLTKSLFMEKKNGKYRSQGSRDERWSG